MTFLVPSRSSSETYKVRCTEVSGRLIAQHCTCMGFRNRAKCAHLDMVMDHPEQFKLESESGMPDAHAKDGTPIEYKTVNVPNQPLGHLKPLPMLAKPLPANFDIAKQSLRYIVEEKFDGIRVLCRKSGKTLSWWSRLGNDATKRVNIMIENEMLQLPDGVYDGELVELGKQGHSYSVCTLANKNGLAYVIFDTLELLGKDCTTTQFHARRKLLEMAFEKMKKERVVLAEQFRVESMEDLELRVQEIWDRGGEGVMVKDTFAPYSVGKRTAHFMKIKELNTHVLEVIGFCPSEGELDNRGPYGMTVLKDEKGIITRVKTLDNATMAELEKAVSSQTFLSPASQVEVQLSSGKWIVMFDHHPYVGRRLMVEYHEKTVDGGYRHIRWDRWAEKGE